MKSDSNSDLACQSALFVHPHRCLSRGAHTFLEHPALSNTSRLLVVYPVVRLLKVYKQLKYLIKLKAMSSDSHGKERDEPDYVCSYFGH